MRLSERARLEVAIRHRVGGIALDVSLALRAPWTVLFGPSGVGKSTVLRVIAGLVRPDAGRVSAGETVLTDTTDGVWVAAHRRAVRMMGQRTALFPHLSVRRNVAYGLTGELRGRQDDDAGDRVEALLKLCRVGHVAEKMPGTLSGGERQRVALARVLGPAEKRVLLLDEPFAGLDAGLRNDLVTEVRESVWVRDVPVLHVTHDVGEVFALGAEVIRMRDGRVAEQGPVGVVLGEERRQLLELLGARRDW